MRLMVWMMLPWLLTVVLKIPVLGLISSAMDQMFLRSTPPLRFLS